MRNSRILAIFIFNLLVFSLLLNSCATIFNGPKDEVYFDSEPRGSKVIVDDVDVGVTPMFYELAAKNDYFVKFEKDSFQVAYAKINSKFDAAYLLLDLLFPGNVFILTTPIPYIIDAATGSYYDLENRYVFARLLPDSSAASDSITGGSNVMLEKEIPVSSQSLKRLQDNDWNVLCFNGDNNRDLKLIKLNGPYLQVDNHGTIFNIPLADITSIEYKIYPDFGKVMAGSFLGLMSGIAAGYLAGLVWVGPNPRELEGLAYAFSILIAAPIGLLIGLLISSTSEIIRYDLSQMGPETKWKFIEHEIFKR